VGVVSMAKHGVVEPLLRVHDDESVSHRVTVPPSTPLGNARPKSPHAPPGLGRTTPSRITA
jgi:hypothetical protein